MNPKEMTNSEFFAACKAFVSRAGPGQGTLLAHIDYATISMRTQRMGSNSGVISIMLNRPIIEVKEISSHGISVQVLRADGITIPNPGLSFLTEAANATVQNTTMEIRTPEVIFILKG